MAWTPKEARKLLDSNTLVSYADEREKLSCFRLASGREIALIEENKSKVSVYMHPAPQHLPGAVVQKLYPPTASKEGRHSNLQLISQTLGFEHPVSRLHVQDAGAMEKLIHWYQYA